MREPIFGLALMAAALASATVRAAEIVDATNPTQILEIIRDHGDATLTKDAMGDPLIEGRIGDEAYRLSFYDCRQGRDCRSLTFSATWEAGDLTGAMITDWNRERRFGKAYLDQEGGATVEMNVNLHGGVTRLNLDDTIGWWQLILAAFPDYYDIRADFR